MSETLSIQNGIVNLKKSIQMADKAFDDSIRYGDEWASPEWCIEGSFLQLLTLVEAAGLKDFYKIVQEDYLAVKADNKPFMEAGNTPDDEPYSKVVSRLRKYASVIEQFFPAEETEVINKDLLQVLRDVHYTIADKVLFKTAPKDEKDVHLRIEGILKCYFNDLKHKPVLTKQIKNFEPDTGIPSLKTLIEYKFLSRLEDVPQIADQVLADTRGYSGKEWSRFIYVIYETNRFRSEKQWIQLLRESEVPGNTTIVVLGGEPTVRSKNKSV